VKIPEQPVFLQEILPHKEVPRGRNKLITIKQQKVLTIITLEMHNSSNILF
jgi:hypothetical protein